MSITPEWLSAIAIYVYFTIQLAKETKKLREVETSPLITVYLQSFKRTQYMELVIKNIGKAPAYDIEIYFDKTFTEKLKEIKQNIPIHIDINYFSPEQSVVYFAGDYEALKQIPEQSFKVHLSYKAKDRKEFTETIHYNYSFYATSDVSKTYEIEELNRMFEKLGNTIDKSISCIAKK
ncbi:hypothetical protein EP073_00980 [Geovibrio thiophilus]|uniref:DUF11 domain-containing protein n=1 Tax=Geovibrio thiophilus TaxID=139438 RepID=A0A3R5X172_9BACT|nr:hypothetical protein [Geovibrio thiophilus]QAR32025.1 hypothetical protein EP073_00980 [Geovibrio thiophilus]